MQMADDRLFELRKTCANIFLGPKERQGSRVVTEQQHPFTRCYRRKYLANLSKMLFAQLLPFRALGWEGVRFEDRQCQQSGRHSNKHVGPDLQPPARLEEEPLPSPVPARQPEPADAAESAQFAQFVIAESGTQFWAKPLAQFGQALARAFKGGIVTNADGGGVTRIVSVRDYVIAVICLCEELVQQMVLAEGVALPDEMPLRRGDPSEERIGDLPELIIVAPGLFGGAGIMNVAQDGERAGLRHGAGRGCTKCWRRCYPSAGS